MPVIETIRNKNAQARQERQFRQAIAAIDATGDLPDAIEPTRQNESFYLLVQEYVDQLRTANTLISAAIADPQSIFYGQHLGDPLLETHLVEDDPHRQIAPPKSYKLNLGNFVTPDAQATIRHLTQIISKGWNQFITTHEAANRYPKKYAATRDWSRSRRSIAFLPFWRLDTHEIYTSRNGNNGVAAFFVPIEQPHYHIDWMVNHLEKMKLSIRPGVLRDQVTEQTAHNYCLEKIPDFYELDLIDVGSVDNVHDTLLTLGWQPLTDPLQRSAIIKSIHRDQIYHAPSDPSLPYLYLDNNSRGITLNIYLSPELQASIRRDFLDKFPTALYNIIDTVIEEARALPIDATFNLSPTKLVWSTLQQLDQYLEDWDYRHELPSLSRTAVLVLIEKFSGHPTLSFLAERLEQLQGAADPKDVVEENLPADIFLGWHPENIKLELPVSILHREPKSLTH